LRVKKP